jgi:hypothetical protein
MPVISGDHAVVVGLDVGGTKTNATLLDETGAFLIDGMTETPSRVHEGPTAAIEAIAEAMDLALAITGRTRDSVLAVGLDTPGPASAGGVISARGATNFAEREWWGFDLRGAVERTLHLPVIYNNDGNAARCTPTAASSVPMPPGARRSRRSWGPVSVAVSSSRVTSYGEPRAWPASWVMSTSRWTACSPSISPSPAATAGSRVTSRASLR